MVSLMMPVLMSTRQMDRVPASILDLLFVLEFLVPEIDFDKTIKKTVSNDLAFYH